MKKISMKDLELFDTTYEGEVKIDGVNAEFFIESLGKEEKMEGLIEFSNKFLVWFQKNSMEVKQFAVTKLLKVKNKFWLETKERPVTKSQFIKKMKLQSIHINYDKSVNLFYSAGRLFWDHGIVVEISRNFKLLDASL